MTDATATGASVATHLVDSRETDDDTVVPSGYSRALAAIRETVTVATVLRTLGAAAMVGSLSVFLLQGFDERGDLTRVFMLLGQSGLLATAGLLVGYALREPKGARVFLSLCLVSVPANFAVLGAMIYSIAPFDSGILIERYPEFARWEAASLSDVGIALAAGLALLVPTTIFAFAVLARRMAGLLSVGLLVTSATLLLPLRDPAIMSIVAGFVLVAVVLLIVRLRRASDLSVRPMTFEEKLAQGLLFLPPLIMIGRSVMVHGVNDYAALPLVMALYFVLYRLLRLARGTIRRQTIVALLATGSAACTAYLVAALTHAHLPDYLVLPAFAIALGALLMPLSRNTTIHAMQRTISGTWLGLAFLTLLPSILSVTDTPDFFSVLFVALLMLGYGAVTMRPRRLLIGLSALIMVMWPQLDNLVPLIMDAGWRALAVIGIATIIAGSLLERFGPALRLRMASGEDVTDGPMEPAIDDTLASFDKPASPGGFVSTSSTSAGMAA